MFSNLTSAKASAKLNFLEGSPSVSSLAVSFSLAPSPALQHYDGYDITRQHEIFSSDYNLRGHRRIHGPLLIGIVFMQHVTVLNILKQLDLK